MQQVMLITLTYHTCTRYAPRPEYFELQDPAPLIWELYILNISRISVMGRAGHFNDSHLGIQDNTRHRQMQLVSLITPIPNMPERNSMVSKLLAQQNFDSILEYIQAAAAPYGLKDQRFTPD
jgi:hypothetical protein